MTLKAPCAICSEGSYSGDLPAFLRADLAAGRRLYRCAECGQYWLETDRFAQPVSQEEALSAVPDRTDPR